MSCGKTGTQQLFLICVKTKRTRAAHRVLALDTGDEDFFSSTMEFLGELSSPILSFPTVRITGDCWGSKTFPAPSFSVSFSIALFLVQLCCLFLCSHLSLQCSWPTEQIHPDFSCWEPQNPSQHSTRPLQLICSVSTCKVSFATLVC